MDDRTLARIVQALIGSRSEGVNWAFKFRQQASKGDLIREALMLGERRARWIPVPRVWSRR